MLQAKLLPELAADYNLSAELSIAGEVHPFAASSSRHSYDGCVCYRGSHTVVATLAGLNCDNFSTRLVSDGR